MIKNTLYRCAMGMAVAGIWGPAAWAQQSITPSQFVGISYSQNFNSMGSAGTTPPVNWLLSSGSSVIVGDGSVGNGGFYNYGTVGSGERALGGVLEGTQRVGIIFQNNTGRTITQIYVQYVVEQWRNGAANSDNFNLSYTVDQAATLGGGAWSNVGGAVNFTSPITSPVNSPLVGDLPANRTPKSALITLSAAVPHGQTFGLRWTSSNVSNADDGLALDDLVVMVPEAWQPSALAGIGLMCLSVWQRRRAAQRAR